MISDCLCLVVCVVCVCMVACWIVFAVANCLWFALVIVFNYLVDVVCADGCCCYL